VTQPNPFLKPEAQPAQPVEIVMILDRSGSMGSLRDDAIGGFNTFLAEQQALPGEANVTLVLFDDHYETPVVRQPVRNVEQLSHLTYVPRGMTALYDAIGRTISNLNGIKPTKAIVCILTDGAENASKQYTQAQVRELITGCEVRGWEVVYLGANQDSFGVGRTLGVKVGNTANFAATGVGLRSAYSATSNATASYRNDNTFGSGDGGAGLLASSAVIAADSGCSSSSDSGGASCDGGGGGGGD
jgi:hypothetical protein